MHTRPFVNCLKEKVEDVIHRTMGFNNFSTETQFAPIITYYHQQSRWKPHHLQSNQQLTPSTFLFNKDNSFIMEKE